MATGAEMGRRRRELIDTARREYEASRPISPRLYTVGEGGAVVPLVLPAEHPLAAEVAIGHVTLAAKEYAAQGQRLQQQLSEDVFVASYAGIHGHDGTVFSYTTWAEDVPSLLPRANRIAFATGVL